MLNKLTQLTSKPRQLFLVDGTGALISFVLLFFVIRPLHTWIGVPEEWLTNLALLPAIYVAISMSCYLGFPVRWRIWMRIVLGANVLYALLTLGLIFISLQFIRWPGLLYFISEIIVLGILISWEWKILRTHAAGSALTNH